MVDTLKFISHVSVVSPFGNIIYSECVPICSNAVDSCFYPVWKVVRKLNHYFDCSLCTFDVRVSVLSRLSHHYFTRSVSFHFSYSDVQPKFKLYE